MQTSCRLPAAGTQATVSGGGFPANTRGTLSRRLARAASAEADAAHVYATTVTDRTGGYSMTFPVPERWRGRNSRWNRGGWFCWWRQLPSDIEASAVFEYRAPSPTQAPRPVRPGRAVFGGPGTQVTVSGGGFGINRNVFVHLAGLVSASARRLCAACLCSRPHGRQWQLQHGVQHA